MQSASDDFGLLTEENIKHEVQEPVATTMTSSAHQVCSYSEYSESSVQDQSEENQGVSDGDSLILDWGSARTCIPWIWWGNALPEMRAVPEPSMMETEPIPRLSGRIDVSPLTELPGESRATTAARQLFRYYLHISFQLLFAPGRFSECTFTFDKVIGSGMMGEVLLISHNRDPSLKFAVKSFVIAFQRTAEMNRRLFFKEISILNKLCHPHIMKPFSEVHCPNRLLMIMPYYPRGNLLSELTRTNMVPYFGQLCDAMAYLYVMKVAHLDIKLENILLREDQRIILTDFGLSIELTTYDDRIAFPNGGTNAYWAPECYQENAMVNLFKLDSYAVGVILWAFMFQRVPHETVNYLGTIRERFCDCNPLRIYAEKLLNEDPNERPVMCTFYIYWVQDLVRRECAHMLEGGLTSEFSRTNSSTCT